MTKHPHYDLNDRIINYAVAIIRLCEELPDSKAGKHIGGQLLRSGTAPAPNYGEAQSAESRADFVHKLKVALKELRECEMWLKVIKRARMLTDTAGLEALLAETDELLAILVSSVQTAKRNMQSESRTVDR